VEGIITAFAYRISKCFSKVVRRRDSNRLCGSGKMTWIFMKFYIMEIKFIDTFREKIAQSNGHFTVRFYAQLVPK
jgi:hypothetical protein